jgi:hypothetical protein
LTHVNTATVTIRVSAVEPTSAARMAAPKSPRSPRCWITPAPAGTNRSARFCSKPFAVRLKAEASMSFWLSLRRRLTMWMPAMSRTKPSRTRDRNAGAAGDNLAGQLACEEQDERVDHRHVHLPPSVLDNCAAFATRIAVILSTFAVSNRLLGPVTPSAPMKVLPSPNTGAATAAVSGSRSPSET